MMNLRIIRSTYALPVAAAAVLMAACAVMDDDRPRDGSAASAGEDAQEQRAAAEAIGWEQPIRVASGGAYRGPWRMNRSEFDFVDDSTVAINDQGYIAVVWADHPQQDILFQLYSPDGEAQLDAPVNISRSGDIFSWLPRVLITSTDDAAETEVFVLWQEIVFSGGSHGGEIFFARSEDGGRSFSEPINLSNSTAGAGKGRLTRQSWHNGSLDIVRCAQGNLYTAWTEYEGNLWFSRSTDNGRSFSRPLHIAGGDGGEAVGSEPARGPSLAVDGEGTIHLVWTIGEDVSADIHYARSRDGGRTFTRPGAVHVSEGHADAPKLVADSTGVVHLVYAESPGGPDGAYHIRYMRIDAGGERFHAPREIVNANALAARGSSFPHLALDGDDNLYLIWERFPAGRGRPVGLGMTRSTDGGTSFESPQLVPGSADPAQGLNGSQQGLLMNKLAVNRRGAVAVVNSTFRHNDASAIWLYRGHTGR